MTTTNFKNCADCTPEFPCWNNFENVCRKSPFLKDETGSGTLHFDPNPTILPRIPCKTKGTIAVTSLRPGCWLENLDGYPLVVTINSSKLKRICVYWPESHQHDSWDHKVLWEGGYRYVGLGKRRKWHILLPAFLRRRISEFSPPTK